MGLAQLLCLVGSGCRVKMVQLRLRWMKEGEEVAIGL